MPRRQAGQYRALGDMLYRARVAQHLSQADVARLVGDMSDSFISRVEAGNARPSPDTIRELARGLKLDAMELSDLAGYIDRPQGDETIKAPQDVAPYIRRLLHYPVDVWAALEETAGAWVARRPKPPTEDEADDAGNEHGTE